MEEEQENLPVAEIAAPSSEATVDLTSISLILEALLLAADGPLSIEQLVKMVGVEFNLGRRELRDALALLGGRQAGTASELVEVASGFRLQVRSEYAEWISRLWQEKPPKYSRALLETLALIVYRQPITRGEIEDVRGVAVSSNILRTLLERGWIRELGHKEVPGRPTLFGSTAQFLDDFNIRTLSQLPALPDIKDLEQLEAALARLGANVLPPPVDDEDDERGAEAAPVEFAEPAIEDQNNQRLADEAEAGATDPADAETASTTVDPDSLPEDHPSSGLSPADDGDDHQAPAADTEKS